jgi:hypothetical protein
MDEQYKSLKEDFDIYISKENVFTQKDRVIIRNKIRTTNNRQYIIPKVLTSLTFSIFIIILLFSGRHLINKETTSSDVGPAKPAPTSQTKEDRPNFIAQDKEIKQKVNEIQDKFKVGMTAQELDQAYGKDFTLVKNPDIEDRTVGDRKYVYMEKPHTSNVEDYELDLENLVKRNVSIQLFIGVTKEGIAERAAIVYVQEKDVMMNFISKNKNSTEKIN